MACPFASLRLVNSSTTIPTQHPPTLDGELRGRDVQVLEKQDNKIENAISSSQNNLSETEEKQNNSQQHVEETPLAKHVRFFTNSDGVITPNSMYEKLRALGISFTRSFLISATVMINITTKVGLKAMHANDSNLLLHPCDSNIFLPDGAVDQEALDAILDSFPDKDYISQIDINGLLADFKERDKDEDTFGIFSSANAGEFDLLIELCTDHWEKIDDKYVPCLTKDTIRQFYEDSTVLFQKVISGELPVKKPES